MLQVAATTKGGACQQNYTCCRTVEYRNVITRHHDILK
jgi:hypothetical protein